MRKCKKLRILCDMDCVMVVMLQKWLEIYGKRTGDILSVNDIHDWQLSKCVKNAKELDKIIEEKGFFFDLEPMYESGKYIKQILEDGHDFIIVTQLPRKATYAAKDKRKWIKKYLHFGKPFDLRNVVFTHRKELVRGDVFFDDSPIHLYNWKAENPASTSVAFNYRYNKDIYADRRVDSWKEFYDIIKELSETK